MQMYAAGSPVLPFHPKVQNAAVRLRACGRFPKTTARIAQMFGTAATLCNSIRRVITMARLI
jgi:hypothetical protein